MKTLIATLMLLAVVVSVARAGINVVTSTTDLASIASLIGGDLVQVTSLARGDADPHYVEVLPSYMIKVKKAQVYLRAGLDLDRWSQSIIDGSRNASLVVVDCSHGITPVNVPTGKVDASMGDIHPRGNPHYWLDPDNGVIIATTIAEALASADAAHAGQYRAGLERFRAEIERRKATWKEKAAPLDGADIVTYHDTWPYFCAAFGINDVGFVEPFPGIEPTPSHTASLIELIKAKRVRVIGVEPYKSTRTPDAIARATEARVVVLPPSVGGVKEANDYYALFDVLIDRLLKEVK
jgi:zinc/manganese transport system substrate-binding protein